MAGVLHRNAQVHWDRFPGFETKRAGLVYDDKAGLPTLWWWGFVSLVLLHVHVAVKVQGILEISTSVNTKFGQALNC